MIIPVRCFTCGKLIAHYWHYYQELLLSGYSEEEALDALQFTRFCCRRMFLTHVDFCDSLLSFNPANNVMPPAQLMQQQQRLAAAAAGQN